MAIRFGNSVTQISCAGCNEVAIYQTVRKNEAYRCFVDDRWYADATDPVSIHYCRQCGPVQNGALPIQAPGGARGAQLYRHGPPLAKGAHDPRLAGIVVGAGIGGVGPVDITVPDDAKQDLRDKLDRAKDAFRLTLTLGDENV